MTQTAAAPVGSSEQITPAERDFAANFLASTRDELAHTLKGLSDAQWNFKPDPDRWSVAQAMEHMAIIEGRIQDLMGRLAEAPADFPMREVKQVDAFVLYIVPDRSFRIRAPQRVSPPGQWTGPVALEHFLDARKKTFELLDSAPNLRGRILPHPVFGSWDGYQWILAAAGHVARHTSQIREVQAHPDFPRA